MKITAEPRSDQINADDLIGGPRIVTVAGVKAGTAEQKYDIQIVEEASRVWRPPLTVLRLLIAAWGDDAKTWVGRRAQLYRDDTVRFGTEAVGGIRVAALSDLPDGKPLKVSLTVSRGRRATVTVDPLPDAAPTPVEPTADQVAACTDDQQLRAWWSVSSPERQAQIKARAAELKAAAEPTQPTFDEGAES